MTDAPAGELPLRDEIFRRMDELTPAERKVARTLLARYPLVLGPLATWLSAFATASNGNQPVAVGARK